MCVSCSVRFSFVCLNIKTLLCHQVHVEVRGPVRPDHRPSPVLVFQRTCRDVPAVSNRPKLVLITSVSIEWAQACKPLTVIHLLLSRHQGCPAGRRPTLSDPLQLPDLLSSPHGSVTSRDAERRSGGGVGGGAERWSLQDRVRSRHHHRETGRLCERTGERWESRSEPHSWEVSSGSEPEDSNYIHTYFTYLVLMQTGDVL